jgi:hypothetical protein
MSKDSWKAGINENTGIIFDNKSSEAQKNAAQRDNTRIFKEYGDEARDYYDSIVGTIQKDAMAERLAEKDRKKKRKDELVQSAGKGPVNISQAKMKQSMGKMGIGMKNNKGGAILKKNVEKMAYGGMSGGKKHMYLAPGGVVKDNPGLKALRESGPKGMEAYKKITGSK